MESLKHRFAKEELARWLISDALASHRLPNFRTRKRYCKGRYLNDYPEIENIFVEYPICIDKWNSLVGLYETWTKPPTYEECIASELLPLVIFDIAVVYDNAIVAFEVVHKHDISEGKEAFLRRIGKRCELIVYTVDAHWILSHNEAPASLRHLSHRRY